MVEGTFPYKNSSRRVCLYMRALVWVGVRVCGFVWVGVFVCVSMCVCVCLRVCLNTYVAPCK